MKLKFQSYLSDLSERLGKTKDEVAEIAISNLYHNQNLFVECDKCGGLLLKEELPNDDVIEIECTCGNTFKYVQATDTEVSRQLIGERIRQLREDKGLSQEQLAEKTGLKKQNISRIELGKYSTGQDILSKIASALGKRLDII